MAVAVFVVAVVVVFVVVFVFVFVAVVVGRWVFCWCHLALYHLLLVRNWVRLG